MTRAYLPTSFYGLLVLGLISSACSQSIKGNQVPGDGLGGDPSSGDGDGDGDDTMGSGGDSSGAGGGGNEPGVFVVEGVDPADEEADVVRDLSEVILDFNTNVDGESIDGERIVIRGPAGPLPVEFEIEGSQVQLNLSSDLQLLATYSVEVASSVSSTGGETLEEDFRSVFTTADGAWTATEAAEGDDPELRIGHAAPKTGIAANGDMLVVYQVQDENWNGLAPHARWYRQATGWEAPIAMDAAQSATCDVVNVSVNAAGDAVVAWSCAATIYVRQYRGGEWESERQELPESGYGRVHVAMLDSGNVIGAYQTSSTAYLSCFTASEENSFLVQSEERTVGPDQYDSVDFDSLEFSVNAEGAALLVWTVVDEMTGDRSVGTLRYNGTTNVWGQSSIIPGSSASAGRHHPTPALSDSNEAMVLWVVTETPGQDDLKASRHTLAGGWGPVSTIDTLDSGIDYKPLIVSMGGRDFLTVYTQNLEIANLYSAFFRNDAWEMPELFSDGLVQVQSPHLAGDRRGNAFVAFGYDVDVLAATDPLALQLHRYSHVDLSWSDLSAAPGEPAYLSTMQLTASPAGYGALTWIGISGSVYQGNPNQRVDVSMKRFE